MVRQRRGRTQRGHALVMALVVLLLVSMAVALVSTALASDLRGVRHELRSLRLTALTDAALAEALAELARDSGFEGSPEHPFGGGVLSSQVVPLGEDLWWVTAEASHGGLERRVRVEVRKTVDGYAISRWRRLGTGF